MATLLAVDEGLGKIIKKLEDRKELDNTLIVFYSDNGFQFGEQGLIDKRTAYEASMRVPLLLHCPSKNVAAFFRQPQGPFSTVGRLG